MELDYGQMSLAILYGLTGTKPPDGDLYDLSTQGIPTSYRKGIKTVIQALINSSKVPRRMPKGVRKLIPSRYTIKDILEAVAKKHPVIFPQMTSGNGMQLFVKSPISWSMCWKPSGRKVSLPCLSMMLLLFGMITQTKLRQS